MEVHNKLHCVNIMISTEMLILSAGSILDSLSRNNVKSRQ